MDMTGQEQNPANVTVASNNRRRSSVWENFTDFRTGDGKSKAKCKKCNRVLAAETRNGTSSLLRHVRTCKPLGGNETDGHESNHLIGSTSVHTSGAWSSISPLHDHYDQRTLLFRYEMPAPSPPFPSDLPPTAQQQPPLLQPAPPLGDPSHPHGSSDRGASGLETAGVGAARPPQPMSPPLSLSLPGSSMDDQDEEAVHNMMSDFEQLCNNMSIDKVQDKGAAPTPQQQQIQSPPCAPSRLGPAGGRSEEPGLEVEEQAHHGPPALESDEARKDLGRMIALHGYDSSFVEDDHFRSFVRRLNPEFEVPSRVNIENMCDGIFDEARRDLLDRARRAPGKVNVAVGTAKTMEEQVMYVACHYIDDGWNLHKVVLYASVTTDHHDDYDGPILGLNISTSATKERVDELFSICGIYKYNSRVFMVAYETTLKDDLCINPKRKEIFFTNYVDSVLHSIARCLEYHLDCDLTGKAFCGIDDLDLTRQGLRELLAEQDLHYEWAYNEHWYDCYCSLEVLCKKGFDLKLTEAELVIKKVLCKLWGKIYRASQKISSSTGPTANLCLTELFKLREVLQRELTRFSNGDHDGLQYRFQVIKNFTCVLRGASDILNKAIEDSYLVWSLPLALDPRYKLKFITFNLERVYGSEAAKEYVSKVMTMITELYADYVKQYGTTGGEHPSDGDSAMDTTISASDQFEQAWNEHCRSSEKLRHQQDSGCYTEAETELDRYLRDPLAIHQDQAEGFDILNWWKAHSSEYPIVARMARDALAMPTCSKLSSDQMAQVRSILRDYSKTPYKVRLCCFLLENDAEEE